MQQVHLIRLRRHDEVVAVKTLYSVRPPHDGHSTPLGHQCGMMTLFLANLPDSNRKGERFFEVPESEDPFKSLGPVSLYHRPFGELAIEVSNFGFGES